MSAGPVWAIIVAGGSGNRYGSRKQFATLGGQRVIDRAVTAASSACDGVVVVLPAGVEWDGSPSTVPVAGGGTRSESVRAGLAAVPADAEVVVVHDAARPLATPALFEAVVAAVFAGADGAVPAMAVSDTVKRVDRDGVVSGTVPREGLVTVQTPQAFRAGMLRSAHISGSDASDDAALVEAAGGRVVVVPGEATNLKVTNPGDGAVAAALLDLATGAGDS